MTDEQIGKLQSKIEYMISRGASSADVADVMHEEEMAELIVRLLKGVQPARIAGTIPVKSDDNTYLMRVEPVTSGFRDKRQSIAIRSQIPRSRRSVVIGISPRKDRIEINASWDEVDYPVLSNVISGREMSTGSNEDGKVYSLAFSDYHRTTSKKYE